MCTPLNKLVKYPLESYSQTSDLLKERINMIREALYRVYGFKSYTLWLHGSQVKGKRFMTNTMSEAPDIDVIIYHPFFKDNWLYYKQQLYLVAKELDFATTLSLSYTKECGVQNVIKIP